MQNRVNLQTVAIDKIVPNTWNPNRQSDFIFEKELTSIKTHGFIDPLLVRETEAGLEIVDGEHRWKAAKQLGFTEVPVNNLGVITTDQAKQLTIIMNEVKGQADSGLLSDLLKNLNDTLGLEHLVANLPYTELELDALIKNAQVGFDELDKGVKTPTPPDEPEVEEGYRTIFLKLPSEDADRFEAQLERMKKAYGFPDDEVSTTQVVIALTQKLAAIPDDQLA